MTCELIPLELTDEQKGRVCGVLSVGCDRQTAANLAGCTPADIRRAMQRDASFAGHVAQAEATSELTHMRNVHEASKEVKNWRASVWWLERRSPERYGRRNAGAITVRQSKAFIAILVDIVSGDIRDASDRQRVVSRLESISGSIDDMLSE